MVMALQMRRVITGHDETGRAIVKIDDVVGNSFEGRPGATVYPVWSSEGFPINNDGQGRRRLTEDRHRHCQMGRFFGRFGRRQRYRRAPNRVRAAQLASRISVSFRPPVVHSRRDNEQ